MNHLEFEKPIVEMESKLKALGNVSNNGDINIGAEMKRIEKKLEKLLKDTYASLDPAQKVQVARHPNRPHFKDYIKNLITDFTPLAGDRVFGEDEALIGGMGRFNGQSCIILGQEKGDDTESRIRHNFGMAKPEGYRKAQRLMDLANRYDIPVLTFVDTAGAYPGLGAEERGQSEAIAKSIESCLRLKVPMVSTIIGEGGSGGAIAIAAANTVLMLEHSIYSVISPEGCASILWRSGDYAKDAAKALRLTAQDLKKLAVIDDIIAEPLGGAHRNHAEIMKNTAAKITSTLKTLNKMDGDALKEHRRNRFLELGSKTL